MRKFRISALLQMRTAFLVMGFLGGVVAMHLWGLWSSPRQAVSNEYRSLSGRGHLLTNPLLSCTDIPEAISIGHRKKLENDVRAFIDASQSAGLIKEASVYYRDLNNGPWFGIREEATFDPASLFKVPLAMTYLWLSNEGSDVLNDMIEYSSPAGTSVQIFPSSTTLPLGGTYSIRELIEYMLKYSDNDAAVILSQYAGLEERNNLYEDLGLRPLEAGTTYLVDTHTYASFFRILFNATYIGVQYSEFALKLLSETDFDLGIVAGVPAGTTVAHKFGEHVSEGPDGTIYQLHDCGIVYAPEKPYVLCVMTRGNDMQKLPSFISGVSRMVYEEVIK